MAVIYFIVDNSLLKTKLAAICLIIKMIQF